MRKPRGRSPGKLRLSMLTGDYEIVRALKDGTVKPEGIDLVIGGYPGSRDIHTKVAVGAGCDINEFNGGQYCVVKDQGLRDIIGIPVFLHRRFRHGFIFINKSAGIAKPADLAGRRIGMNSYGPAAHYWMRGHLEHDFGVPHRSLTYVVERREDVPAIEAPADLKIELLPRGGDVEQMLLAGELDAIMAPGVMREVAERDPRVAHLWENYEEVERDYYRRTGIFPIMHITTVPMEIVARYPWVVGSLTRAFEEAKQLAFQRVANPRIVPLAWWRSHWENERFLLGRDPWEYGLSEINRKNYELLAQFVFEQGMTRRRMPLQDLFAREAFEIELPLPRYHEVAYDF
ncbi:MAG: ABC transporter substrate-binding protein [Burkholderiales bacterium]|nr:ABC transporter substrate-binding protein [Burkholderiales bacterium]